MPAGRRRSAQVAFLHLLRKLARLPVYAPAQQDKRRAAQHCQYTKQFFQGQLLAQKKYANKATDDGHEQQVELYDPDLIVPEIAVIEKVDPRLRKTAQRHHQPHKRREPEGGGGDGAGERRRAAEEGEHDKVVIV